MASVSFQDFVSATPTTATTPAVGTPATVSPSAAGAGTTAAPTGAGLSDAPATYQYVAPYPSPDGSGGMTTIAPQDYSRFMSGLPPLPAQGAAPSSQAVPASPSGGASASPTTPPSNPTPASSPKALSFSDFVGNSQAKPPSEASLSSVPATPPAPASAMPVAAATTQPPAPQGAPPAPGVQPTTKITGLSANIGAGTSDAVAGTLGLPVDAATGAINLGVRGINAVTGANLPTIQNPVAGSQWWKSAMGLIGANPDNVVPGDIGQQLARSAASGAAGALLPMGVAGQVARLAGSAAPVLSGVAGTIADAPLAATAASGAAAGTAGTVATDSAKAAGVPEAYLPTVNMLAQLAGGGAGLAATGLGTLGARAAGNAYDRLTSALPIGSSQPITGASGAPILNEAGAPVMARPAQAARVGAGLAAKAGMAPADLADALPTGAPVVPGAPLTAGQATGNLGLLNVERDLQNTSRAAKEAFTSRRVAQSQGQLAHLRSLAPKDAQANAAANYFVNRLNQIDAQEADASQAARAHYEELASKVGGVAHPSDIGKDMATHVGEYYRPGMTVAESAIARQRAIVARQASAAGGDRAGAEGKTARQSYGKQLADSLKEIRDAANKERRALYDARDPEGKLAIQTAPIGAGAKSLREELKPAVGDKLTEPEERLIKAAEDLPRVASMADIAAYRKNVNAALREAEAGKNVGKEGAAEASRRFSILKAAVDQAEAEATERAAKAEGAGVVSGKVAPEETVLGRLAEHAAQPAEAWGQNLESQVQKWYADAHAADRESNRVQGAGRYAASGSGGISSASRTQSQGGGRFGQPSASAGNQDQALQENLTPADAARFKAADAFNRVYQNRFGPKTPAGQVLATGPGGDLKMALTSVASTFWKRGPLGAESTQNLVAAFGSPQAAEKAIGDYAAFDLKSYASNPDGLSAVKLQKWLDDHDGALNEFPGLRQKFSTLQRAAATLDSLKQARARLEALNPAKPSATGAETLAQFIKPGAKGGEAVDAYMKHTGGTAAARATLADGFAYSLRSEKMKDGELTASGYDAWKAQYASALDRVPEVKAQFDTLADARRASDAAAARALQERKNYLKSVAGYYITKDGEAVNSSAAVKSIIGSQTGASDAREIVRQMKGDPAALQGLRLDFADWIMRQATNTAEAGSSGESEISVAKLQGIVDNPSTMAVLREVFTPEQVKGVVEAVAQSARQAARSHNATKLPGSPGTAADLNATHSSDPHEDVAGALIAENAGELLGHVLGLGIVAKLLVQGGSIAGRVYYGAAKAAGIQTERDLMTQAMLNPELMRTLLVAARQTAVKPAIIARLQGMIANLSLMGASMPMTPAYKAAPQQSLGTPDGMFPSVGDFAAGK